MRPTAEQTNKLCHTLFLTRKLYNDALQELIDNYKITGKHMHRYEQDKLHNTKRHPDLNAYVVDEVLNQLHRSFSRFFNGLKSGKRVGFPRFKSDKRWNSFAMFAGCNSTMTLRGSRFYAGKKMGGKIRVSLHNEPLGNQKLSRILRRASGWYLQITTDYIKPTLSPVNNAVGLDFGITSLISDSDGNKITNPQFFKSSMKKLRIAQRKMARRERGSKRREKARIIASRIQERIANQRKDFFHKTTRYYINLYDTIVIEDLTPLNLIKNPYLSRMIMDSSWGTLRVMLESKAGDAGRQVIAVPPKYTSQRCSKCGEIVRKSLSVRTHICPWCGLVEDRDVNAAKNILRAGVRPSGVNVEVVNSSVARETSQEGIATIRAGRF